MSNRYALLVATYQYDDDNLRRLIAPAKDAEMLARVLSDPDIGGFQTKTLLNESSFMVRQEIEAFFLDRKSDDLLLLYFSGHGLKDDYGKLYYAFVDTTRTRLRSTAISANYVNEAMRDSRSRQQVLLLDCCYSGAFAKGMVAKADMKIGSLDLLKGQGRVVLTASDSIQYAFESDNLMGEGKSSVFTRILVDGLETGKADRDQDGLISLDELYDYVNDKIIEESSYQRPEKWFLGVQGEIIIAKNPHLSGKMVELPKELQKDLESPYPWRRKGAVSELGQLIQSRDQELSNAALQALSRLADDDSKQVSAAANEVLHLYTKPDNIRETQILSKEPDLKSLLKNDLELLLSTESSTAYLGDEVKWILTVNNRTADELKYVTAIHGKTLLERPFNMVGLGERRLPFSTKYQTVGKKTEKIVVEGISGRGKRLCVEITANIQVLKPALQGEVDISGKVENVDEPTVLALANGMNFSIYLSGLTKKEVLEELRRRNPNRSITKIHVQFFAVLLFTLLKDHINQLQSVLIDSEYQGHEVLIKEHLLNLFHKHKITVEPTSIHILKLNKLSPAHKLAISVFREMYYDEIGGFLKLSLEISTERILAELK